MTDKQHTLKCKYTFKGKGLHTGRNVTMVLEPAPAGHGIKFRRTDLGTSFLGETCMFFDVLGKI